MDVIIESVGDRERAESVTHNIEKLVDIGWFKIKGWTILGSYDSQNEKEIASETYAPTEKILGVGWRPVEDHFCLKVNFSGRKRKLHTEPDRILSTNREVSCEVDKVNDSLQQQQHLWSTWIGSTWIEHVKKLHE